MSYAERLNDFDNARASTSQHIEEIRKSLSNPEYEDNPVKAGLETAGSVLGTGEGLLRLKRELGDKGTLRNTAKAIYNKLRNPADLRNELGDNLKGQLNQKLRNFSGRGQSSGSAVSDEGGAPTRAVRKTLSGATEAPDSAGVTPATDPLESGVNSFPQTTNPTAEANTLNRQINSKVRSNLSSDEIGDLNSRLANRPNLDNVNALPEGDTKVASQAEYLKYKNSVANDAISRKASGSQPAESYDVRGNPQSAQSQASSADAADGTASTGSNATRTTVGDAVDPSLPNPVSATDVQGAGARAGQTVSGVAEDSTNASSAVAASTDDGANIVARGQALALRSAQVPASSGQGSVAGLTSASTADSQSGAAHIVSQASSGNAVAHSSAEAPGSQTSMGNAPNGAQSQASAAGESAEQRALSGAGADLNDASRAASNADEVSTAAKTAGNGLKSAMGVEEGLDELAPETGPLAPFLEVGSLLATLGTSIASLFEPSQEKKPQAPKPPPKNLAIGANLKSDATGSVGAF